MSTQAVSSSSLYQEIRSFYQNRGSDMKSLGNALNSGDLSAAQDAFSDLVALGQQGPYVNAEPFSKSDRAAAFDAIGTALQAGDVAGAESAYATLEGELNSGSPDNSVDGTAPQDVSVDLSSDQTSGTEATDTESIYQQLQEFRKERKADLKQLDAALGAGDLNAAQTAYNALSALGDDGPYKNGEPFAKSDRAGSFEAIGTALEAGDLAGAQSAFATLESELHTPQDPNPPLQAGNTGTVTAPPHSPTNPPVFSPFLPVNSVPRNGTTTTGLHWRHAHGGPVHRAPTTAGNLNTDGFNQIA